uniref:Uncharacterized protein n=1 Tax=Glossina austeni TaxID=7395 RepID=A0A1A9V1L1_GLOAU
MKSFILEDQVAQARDNVVGVEEATDFQETAHMMGKATTTPVGKVDIRNINMIISPHLFSDELCNSGPSTARPPTQLQRCLAVDEGQAVEPQPDSVVPDVEELRKVVKCLTPEDKVVQICFDEVSASNQAVYSQRTDTLIGCHSADEKKKTTCAYKTIYSLPANL